MVRTDVSLNTSYRVCDVAVKNKSQHTAMADGASVLPLDKTKHSEPDVLGEVWTEAVSAPHIQPFTFQSKIDVFSRVHW